MPVDPPDGPDPERLRRLEKRIAEKKRELMPGPRADEHINQANIAWRMVIEMVSGLGIGFGIGYGLDRLFGTLPFMLVIFTLLGFAAGVRVMLRTAREVQGERLAEQSAREEGK